jgi:PEP-CTERM motif
VRIQFAKSRMSIYCTVLFLVLAVAAKADNIAFMGTVSGEFGTIDLNTGVFNLLGNSGVTLAGMAVANATLYGSSYHTSTGILYSINPTNGSLATIGTSSLDIDDFGSTTAGLYAVGVDANLYSINASTGAPTLIGPTGLGFGSWRSLSTNSSTLYFADGVNLYTLNTTTGAATLVGSMGGPEMGAMLVEGGFLYGGQNTSGLFVDTLNTTTGLATIGPSVTGTSSSFFALAPNPLPTSTPEPSSLLLLGSGVLGLAGLVRRKINF